MFSMVSTKPYNKYFKAYDPSRVDFFKGMCEKLESFPRLKLSLFTSLIFVPQFDIKLGPQLDIEFVY